MIQFNNNQNRSRTPIMGTRVTRSPLVEFLGRFLFYSTLLLIPCQVTVRLQAQGSVLLSAIHHTLNKALTSGRKTSDTWTHAGQPPIISGAGELDVALMTTSQKNEFAIISFFGLNKKL